MTKLLALVLNQTKLSIIKVSLLFNRLNIVKEELMILELLVEVLLKRRQNCVDLLHALWSQWIQRLSLLEMEVLSGRMTVVGGEILDLLGHTVREVSHRLHVLLYVHTIFLDIPGDFGRYQMRIHILMSHLLRERHLAIEIFASVDTHVHPLGL